MRRIWISLSILAVVTAVAVPTTVSATPDRVLLITLHGNATAAQRGPVDLREAGSWVVRWSVPRSQLAAGRRFLSTSAVVIGTTSAHGGSTSCQGTLAARRAPFALLVMDERGGRIDFSAFPSPFATAVSSTCPQGLSASTWPLKTAAQRQAWRIFNHPGFGFSLPNFTPLPKGGDTEGWHLTYGLQWLTRLTVTDGSH